MNSVLLSEQLITYLALAVFFFSLGIVGLVRHRTLIGMLISVELILNAAGLNFMAINRFLVPDSATGWIFTLFIIGIAAAEAAIVLSIIVAVYRKYKSADVDDVCELKG